MKSGLTRAGRASVSDVGVSPLGTGRLLGGLIPAAVEAALPCTWASSRPSHLSPRCSWTAPADTP
jgi:hypothetical protein